MKLIKNIERGYRQIRSYLQPSHYRSAAKARSLAVPPPQDKPICLFDFHSIQMDKDMGRYLHHLITEFESCGYHIALTNNYRFLATIEGKAFKKPLLQRPFSIFSLTEAPENCHALISDHPQTSSQPFDHTVTIDYREIQPPQKEAHSVALPYFVHPEVQDSQQVSHFHKSLQHEKPRTLRILFAGNAQKPKYGAPILASKYNVLSRVKVLDIAQQSLTKDQLRTPQSIDALIPAEYSNTLSIATTQSCPIPSQDWISTLGKADFYLACPGVGMPLCHNLIEALAAGAIPILQYPQYLTPPLTDGENCLVFNNAEELQAALRKALSIDEREIRKLHKNALAYYKQHLQPGSLTKKLMSPNAPTTRLFVNAYHAAKPSAEPS